MRPSFEIKLLFKVSPTILLFFKHIKSGYCRKGDCPNYCRFVKLKLKILKIGTHSQCSAVLFI